jgi:tubulin-folding cofactor B
MIGTRAEDLPSIHQSQEMAALRDYVCANDATRYNNQAEGILRMDVTHSNLIQRWHDIKFEDTMTVGQVKDKLYRHGGTPAAHQELYLRRGGGDIIFLMEDHKPLKYYGARNGMEIHIKDTDPYSISKHGGLEDVSQVEKYNMKDDDYDKWRTPCGLASARRRPRLSGAGLRRLPERAPRELARSSEGHSSPVRRSSRPPSRWAAVARCNRARAEVR